MFILVFVIFILGFTNIGFIILVTWVQYYSLWFIIPWGFIIVHCGLCFPWVHNINPLGL